MRLVLLLAVAACAEFDVASTKDGSGSSDTASSDGGDADADADADDTNEAFEAAAFSVAATLPVRGGEAVADGGSVWFVLASSSTERLDCAALDATSLAAAEPPTSSIYAYWTLTVPADTGCEGDPVLPATLGLGIGELDPEVRARLGTVDRDGEADMLWGAWVVADGGAPFGFGYAEAGGGVLAGDPPPDGDYALEPLLIMRLSETE